MLDGIVVDTLLDDLAWRIDCGMINARDLTGDTDKDLTELKAAWQEVITTALREKGLLEQEA